MVVPVESQITTILAVDAVGGGTLVAYREGEVVPLPSDAGLLKRADEVAIRLGLHSNGIPRYFPPAGATDQVAFARWGFRGLTIGAVDGRAGKPTHYHLMSDTADNIDEQVLNRAVEYCTEICRDLMRR